MNKKNYFNGLNAKLALAVVALTSVMLTSCDKENFTVDPTKPVELADASAVIGASAYDNATGAVLTDKVTFAPNQMITIAATNGTIAAGSETITASLSGYFDETLKVDYPAVAKGQMIYIPAVFYMSTIPFEINKVPTSGTEKENTDLTNTETLEGGFQAGQKNTLKATGFAGIKIKEASYKKALEDIAKLTFEDGVVVESSRAIAEEIIMDRVKIALTQTLESMKDFKKVEITFDMFVPEQTASIKVTVTAVTEEGVMSISTTQNDRKWTISGIEYEEVVYNNIVADFIDKNGHAHGHAGHGVSNNAGGGSAGK